MKPFPTILLICAAFLSLSTPGNPVPGKNDVMVGETAVKLIDRELVLDYEICFGQNVAACVVDIIVLADKVPYRFTRYYSGDCGRLGSPGKKQVRLNIAPNRELLAGKDIKFRIDVIRKELKEGKPIEAAPAATMPDVVTETVAKIDFDKVECGGTVISDGGAPVTVKGFVWSLEPNPTLSSKTIKTRTADKKGSGEFSGTLHSLEPGRKYYVRAYATNSVGTFYGQEIEFSTEVLVTEKMGSPLPKDDNVVVATVPSSTAANCYIVSKSGEYKFKTVKGNSDMSVGDVASATVLWESFGMDMAPAKGDLIKSVSYDDGVITFSTAEKFRKGNAVIAAKDIDGNILWSWHIWLTDEPKGQVYKNNAGVMMDRNLGATSATPGDVGALGLLYQWGRKDPFLGASSINEKNDAKSTISWPSAVESTSSTGTIDYATAHPTTFIGGNSSNGDWYYTGGSSTDDTRWQSSKTIYDPCPAGWRVPDGGSGGVWATAFGTSSYWAKSSNWNSTYKGMDFSKTDKKLGSSGPIWYPASGYRNSIGGSLYSVGSNGYCWSVSPSGKDAYYLLFDYCGCVYPAFDSNRAYGRSVRCLQE